MINQVLQITFTTMKILNQDGNLVGRDIGITIVAAGLPFFAQVGLVFYFFVVLNCLSGYGNIVGAERNQKLIHQLKYLRSVSYIIPGLSLFCKIIPSIGIAYPEYQNDFIYIYLIGNGLIAWLYGVLATMALRFLLVELKNHINSFPQSSEDLKSVVQRLTYAYYVIGGMSFAIGATYVMFGASEFWRRKCTYLFIFQQITCPPAATILILTVSRLSNTDRNVTMKQFLKSVQYSSKGISFHKLNVFKHIKSPFGSVSIAATADSAPVSAV